MAGENRKWLVLAAMGCCFAMESVLSAAESEPKPVYDRARAQELLNMISSTNTELWLDFELPKSAAPNNEFVGEMPYAKVRLTWEDFRLEELKVGVVELFDIWYRSELQKTFPSVKSLTIISEPSYCGPGGMEEIAAKLSMLKSFPLSTVKMSGGHDLVEGEGCAYSGPFGKDCLAFTAREGHGWFNLVTEKFEKDVVRCPNVKILSYKDVCVVCVVPKEGGGTDTIGTRWGCEICDYVIKGAKFSKARFLVRESAKNCKNRR